MVVPERPPRRLLQHHQRELRHVSRVAGASTEWGANLVQWPCVSGWNDHVWYFANTRYDGYYYLVNYNSRLVMGVGGSW
jgi:hypothetical protein